MHPFAHPPSEARAQLGAGPTDHGGRPPSDVGCEEDHRAPQQFVCLHDHPLPSAACSWPFPAASVIQRLSYAGQGTSSREPP
jgi:hypothetical protein